MTFSQLPVFRKDGGLQHSLGQSKVVEPSVISIDIKIHELFFFPWSWLRPYSWLVPACGLDIVSITEALPLSCRLVPGDGSAIEGTVGCSGGATDCSDSWSTEDLLGRSYVKGMSSSSEVDCIIIGVFPLIRTSRGVVGVVDERAHFLPSYLLENSITAIFLIACRSLRALSFILSSASKRNNESC